MNIRKISRANGEITVPGDKSISHRGVMLGALANGVTEIDGFLSGADCLSTIDCFRKMGIPITIDGSHVTVHGQGLYGLEKPAETLYTGNSGTTTRLLCGILAGQDFDTVITGDASICKRPMKRVVAPLSEMGARIRGDYCPLYITGSKLHGMEYRMPVASAQVKTSILLAGLYAEGQTVIHEPERSRNHTEFMLTAMGADLKVQGNDILLTPGKELAPQNISVPGDISSAAFFMVLAAILPDSRITIRNVGINPTRTGILDVFEAMGAEVKLQNIRTSAGEPAADITVSSSSLKGTVIGGDLIPRLIDELPVIAVAALFAEGETVIKHAQELKGKETNRIRAVVDEFRKCGAEIEETEDGMVIQGGKMLHGADFCSYADHRMAMSLTVLAQLLEGESTLDDEQCVSISYPKYFEDFYSLA